MGKFVKSILKGLLYVVCFPALVAGILLFAIFSIFIFLFQLGKLIYLFFTGRTLFSDLDEDIKAKQILAGEQPKDNQPVPSSSPFSMYPNEEELFNEQYPEAENNKETPQEEQPQEDANFKEEPNVESNDQQIDNYEEGEHEN